MNKLDQKLCAWGGPLFVVCFFPGLVISGFMPPPTPALSAAQIAAHYQDYATLIQLGMILALFGIVGLCAFVAVITAQMREMRGSSQLPADLQLGAGSLGAFASMLPMLFIAICAFRPDRNPEITMALNDTAWLIMMAAFPTFVAQFLAIAMGVFQDARPDPIFSRWVAYFNIWVALFTIPGVLAFMFKTGPFAWNGIFTFWLAASAFGTWLIVMTVLVLRNARRDLREV